MLKKILDQRSCAECRLCCGFDSSDIWEIPVFTAETAKRMPDTEFTEKNGGFIVKTPELKDEEIFFCPALTDKGCSLGDEKPFDCRIWPFRIMEIGGKRAITIASVCKKLYNRPLSELTAFLEEGLADKIFSYADKHPEIVKPYCTGYPALIFESY